MFSITARVTCVRTAPGVYRLYHENRWVGEAVAIDKDALRVSRSFSGNGCVVASLRDAARWLEAIEGAVAAPLAAA